MNPGPWTMIAGLNMTVNPTLYEQYRTLLRLRIEVARAEAAAARAEIKRMDKRK